MDNGYVICPNCGARAVSKETNICGECEWQPEPVRDFREELKNTINSYSKENGSNTADLILAEYLVTCLNAFDMAVNQREAWFGRPPATPFEPVSMNIKATK